MKGEWMRLVGKGLAKDANGQRHGGLCKLIACCGVDHSIARSCFFMMSQSLCQSTLRCQRFEAQVQFSKSMNRILKRF